MGIISLLGLLTLAPQRKFQTYLIVTEPTGIETNDGPKVNVDLSTEAPHQRTLEGSRASQTGLRNCSGKTLASSGVWREIG